MHPNHQQTHTRRNHKEFANVTVRLKEVIIISQAVVQKRLLLHLEKENRQESGAKTRSIGPLDC